MAEDKQRKSGFVALIGRPNVGKSTLMNRIIGQKVAITSPRPQTTRNRIRTILTEERGQIVFVDTPGIHKAKNRLGDYMLGEVSRSLKDADLILWLTEPLPEIREQDLAIAEQLKSLTVPVFLLINKIDAVSKTTLLKVIDAYRELLDFQEILPVSALKGEHTDELVDCIFDVLPEGPCYYDEDTLTDQPMRQIAAELIREQALRMLDQEIPHGIAVVIDRMEYRERKDNAPIYDIDATIVCEKDSHKGIIIGKGGSMLKKIGSKARPEIEEMCECAVNLKLWVKVRDSWRENQTQLNNFGYREEKRS